MSCIILLGGMGFGSAMPLPWTSKDGKTIDAELVEYEWASQQLILQEEGAAQPMPVFVHQLDLQSKVQLLLSPEYRTSLDANRDVEALPFYKTRSSELRTITLVLCITYVVTLFSISWVLASWILREGNIVPLMKVALLYLGLSTCVGFLIWQFGGGLDLLGAHRAYLFGGLAVYVLFFVALAMWIFRAGFFRAFTWYFLTTLTVFLLPMTLFLTGFISQVYKTQGELTEETAEKYLMETWWEPLGLL